MKNPYFLLLLLVISIFQMELLHYIPIFTYFDEAITIWALFVILKNGVHNKRFRWMLAIIVFTTLIGVSCNYYFKYQTDAFPIINDIGNCFKVFITYIGASIYYSKMGTKQFYKFINIAFRFVAFLIVIMFPLSIANIFVDFGMRQDIRYGLPSFAFIFGGGGKLSMLFYLLITILTTYFSKFRSLPTRHLLLLLAALFIWTMTLRARAILFVITFCLLFWIIIYKKKRFKINLGTIAISIFLFYLVCIDQIETYAGNDSTARYNLLFYGIKTMITRFPWGCGFGTFGTDVAAKYYSPLYYEYGMDYIYGLHPENPKFSHDSYWPAIMGQFGFIGIVCFAILIILLFGDIYRKSRNNCYLFAIGIFLCFTQTIASFATAVFFHFVTVNLVFFVAIIINQKHIELYDKKLFKRL